MAEDVLLSWTEQLLCVRPSPVAERFANGFLFNELLSACAAVPVRHTVAKDADRVDAMLENYCMLADSLARLGIYLSANDAHAIVERVPGAATQLLHQLYCKLVREVAVARSSPSIGFTMSFACKFQYNQTYLKSFRHRLRGLLGDQRTKNFEAVARRQRAHVAGLRDEILAEERAHEASVRANAASAHETIREQFATQRKHAASKDATSKKAWEATMSRRRASIAIQSDYKRWRATQLSATSQKREAGVLEEWRAGAREFEKSLALREIAREHDERDGADADPKIVAEAGVATAIHTAVAAATTLSVRTSVAESVGLSLLDTNSEIRARRRAMVLAQADCELEVSLLGGQVTSTAHSATDIQSGVELAMSVSEEHVHNVVAQYVLNAVVAAGDRERQRLNDEQRHLSQQQALYAHLQQQRQLVVERAMLAYAETRNAIAAAQRAEIENVVRPLVDHVVEAAVDVAEYRAQVYGHQGRSVVYLSQSGSQSVPVKDGAPSADVDVWPIQAILASGGAPLLDSLIRHSPSTVRCVAAQAFDGAVSAAGTMRVGLPSIVPSLFPDEASKGKKSTATVGDTLAVTPLDAVEISAGTASFSTSRDVKIAAALSQALDAGHAILGGAAARAALCVPPEMGSHVFQEIIMACGNSPSPSATYLVDEGDFIVLSVFAPPQVPHAAVASLLAEKLDLVQCNCSGVSENEQFAGASASSFTHLRESIQTAQTEARKGVLLFGSLDDRQYDLIRQTATNCVFAAIELTCDVRRLVNHVLGWLVEAAEPDQSAGFQSVYHMDQAPPSSLSHTIDRLRRLNGVELGCSIEQISPRQSFQMLEAVEDRSEHLEPSYVDIGCNTANGCALYDANFEKTIGLRESHLQRVPLYSHEGNTWLTEGEQCLAALTAARVAIDRAITDHRTSISTRERETSERAAAYETSQQELTEANRRRSGQDEAALLMLAKYQAVEASASTGGGDPVPFSKKSTLPVPGCSLKLPTLPHDSSSETSTGESAHVSSDARAREPMRQSACVRSDIIRQNELAEESFVQSSRQAAEILASCDKAYVDKLCSLGASVRTLLNQQPPEFQCILDEHAQWIASLVGNRNSSRTDGGNPDDDDDDEEENSDLHQLYEQEMQRNLRQDAGVLQEFAARTEHVCERLRALTAAKQAEVNETVAKLFGDSGRTDAEARVIDAIAEAHHVLLCAEQQRFLTRRLLLLEYFAAAAGSSRSDVEAGVKTASQHEGKPVKGAAADDITETALAEALRFPFYEATGAVPPFIAAECPADQLEGANSAPSSVRSNPAKVIKQDASLPGRKSGLPAAPARPLQKAPHAKSTQPSNTQVQLNPSFVESFLVCSATADKAIASAEAMLVRQLQARARRIAQDTAAIQAAIATVRSEEQRAQAAAAKAAKAAKKPEMPDADSAPQSIESIIRSVQLPPPSDGGSLPALDEAFFVAIRWEAQAYRARLTRLLVQAAALSVHTHDTLSRLSETSTRDAVVASTQQLLPACIHQLSDQRLSLVPGPLDGHGLTPFSWRSLGSAVKE